MSSQGSQEFVLVEDDDLADYNEAGILPQPAKIQTEIQKWLQPTDYNAESSEYNKHLTSYVLGTDLWIQETEAYKQWHDSPDHGSLWVKAIAGAGKSVFAAMIASKLAETEKVPVLPFFFRQIIATNHDPHSMTRDWISMILKHSPLLQARMKKYMDDRRALENITANEFWHDLVHALVSLPKVYCVVDALDEMDIDQEAFFKNLVDLGKRKPSTVKILMTSRPLPRIEAYLKDPSVLQVRLEQRKVDEDIALYVQYRLTKTPQLNDDVRRSVKAAIGRKAQGSFLYARLMLDEFDHRLKEMLPEDRFIERSLSWLPATLEDMYNGMLLDHSLRSGVSQDLQLTILRWVTHSTRPLRLLELAAMLDSQNGRGKDTKAVVRTACGPLLEILEDETVSVIHHSFTEFLIDQDRRTRAVVDGAHPQFPVIDSIATHSSMSHTCLNYLTSGRLNDWEIKARTQDEAFYRPPASTQKNLKMKHPFLDYAMNNWYIHAGRLVPINSILLAELDGFMKVGNPSFTAWVDLVWIVSTTISKVTPLHVASWAGMASYVQHLLTLTIESNSPDPQERTPLSWASAKGHVEVVRLLLEKVSDPDVDDYFGLKPLHYAAQGNHHKIVKLLLEAGVSPLTGKTRDPGRFCGNSPSSIGHSPLMYACEAGCTETVREMTPYLKPKDLDDALCWAARSGKSHVVDILLSSPGISLDSRGDTPLFLASGGLHYEAMRSLLKKGANPNKRSMNFADQTGMLCLALDNIKATQPLGPTPLHAVCGVVRNNHTRQRDDENMKKCFKLLLDTGCDVNTVDQDGKTPLHCSIAENQWGLAQLLLENGADPMNRDKSGNTPLHLVLPSKSSVHVVELLLAKGANLNDRRPSDGCTPLHTMLGSIHGFKIEVLLPHVSDWNIEDDQGNTPLHHVLSQSHNPKPVVLELLKAGADLNRRNKNGETPIHVIKDSAGFRPVNDILPLLLAAGASLEAKDNDGRSLLLRVLNRQLWNAQKDVQYLLDIGADINTCDNEGNSVLHTVCMKGPGEVLIKTLLTAGANPLAINHAGNTILHELMRNYASGDGEMRVTVMNLLLKLGLSSTAQNYLGQTPLHIACGSKPTQHLGSKVDPFDFILKCHIDSVNTGDFHGVRPIHLAATISEQTVARLIRNGANCSISTHEGRNLLHIASRARQSNVTGLLLEHFLSIGRLDLLNSQDKLGRTPLHDACRSGRPETVALLLNAGADPKIKDKQNYTPLHACAEFEEESVFWSDLANQLAPKRTLDAAGVLISDPLRPDLRNRTGQGRSSGCVSCDNDSVRIREIIRLLIAHGAELAFPSPMIDPIDAAIVKRCADMVDDLLPSMEAIRAKAGEEKRPWHMAGTRRSSTPFQERYMVTQWRATVKESDIIKNNRNPQLCNELLKMRQYSAIEQLLEMGVDFSPKIGYGGDFLTTLAEWGYTFLFEKLGATISRSNWVDGIESPEHDQHKTLTPYLITAARSVLPNLDMIKVIVGKFGANVNIQPESRVYRTEGGNKNLPGLSALHILACADHWWHSGAIEYLLEHGASTELRNEAGLSVLHLAVGRNYASGGYRQREVVKLLLKYGADPNSMDDNGLTCLNSAMHDVELVRLLIEHGADICRGNKPVLFSAISTQDVVAVRVILGAGADCNIRQERSKTYTGKGMHDRIHDHEYYPIHYAAASQFNNPKTRSTAVEIIKLLLDKGANPYLQFREDSTILHDIFQFGGIIQPFLEAPDLDLECRDLQGRTLLLASCLSTFGTNTPATFSPEHSNKNLEERAKAKGDPPRALTLYKRGGDLSATDNKDNNALHLLPSAKYDGGEEYRKTFAFFIQEAPELVHQKNVEGWKPLHYAFQQRRVWSSVTLLDAGADPLEPDPNGDTPLHFIAPTLFSEAGQAEWLPRFKRFLDMGIDINARNNKGETPLFAYIAGGNYRPGGFPWELKEGHQSFYRPFEDAGADVFARNNEGENLLHLTAKKADHTSHMRRLYGGGATGVDTFKFLMEKGLDPMEEDNNQRTALDVAAACGNEGILALFKRDKTLAKEEKLGRDAIFWDGWA